ncbi:reverse transcriptase domain-containing protein [Tanacetum coccineum]
MADNRTMAQMLQAPIEGYEDAIVVPPINANNFELKQPLINLVQSNKYNGRPRPTQSLHLRFFNKVHSTFRHSRSSEHFEKAFFAFPFFLDGEARKNWTPFRNVPQPWLFQNSTNLLLFYQLLNQKIRCLRNLQQVAISRQNASRRLAIIETSQSSLHKKSSYSISRTLVVTTPAPVKAVEEVCVTCGSNHNFTHCPLTRGGNDFPVFQDNIQQFQQTAAVGNFLQRNQPSNLASQMRPPGFNQPNVQTNQNRGGNFNQNRQNNQNQVYQAPPYQTPTNQPPINQVLPYQPPTNSVLKTDFENYVKANDAVLKNVQNQGQNLQNQMANVTSLLTSLCDNFKNSASTSNSGTLPSQTVTNPRQQINAITTRSGKALEEPSIPLVPSPDVSKPQKEPEQNPETSTEKVQNPKLENTAHVPSSGEEDSIFIEIPKPKAKETVSLDPNPNSYPSKLPYPERMKVREHDKPSAQHSRFLKMFKQLRLEIGLKDALVEMPKFNKWLSSLLRNKEKLEEIAITTVNAECSAIIMNKVPEKLEDPGKFLIPCALQELKRTSALADSGASINLLPHSIYKKLELEALTPTRMTLELANRSISHPMGIAEDVVVRVDGFTFLADFVVVNFEPDPRVPIILGRPFLRTAKALIDLYEETLTLRVGKEELMISGSTTTHSDDPSPSSSPVKTSDNLEEFIDELTLLKKIFKKEIFKIIQILFLNLMTISNLFYSTTPLSDRLMCFAPEDDNDEDRCFSSYGSFFFIFEEEVLCEISTSQSQENVHANQSSIYQGHLPVSPIPVEDSEPAQEEIDIFLVPDDLIPPGVENDDSEDEVNELPNLDHHIIRQFLVLSGTTGC